MHSFTHTHTHKTITMEPNSWSL